MIICKKLFPLLMLSLLTCVNTATHAKTDLLDHSLEELSPNKGTVNLKEAYQGKVILAVNTASGCGFAPQYEGLEKLYQKYKDQGLVVLGFPSNDFYQEAREEDEIVEFCKLNYGVTFPIFKKSSVKGNKANPFYRQLAATYEDKAPNWNFFKYLIDQNQNVIELFPSKEKPIGGRLEQAIKSLLEIKKDSNHSSQKH